MERCANHLCSSKSAEAAGQYQQPSTETFKWWFGAEGCQKRRDGMFINTYLASGVAMQWVEWTKCRWSWAYVGWGFPTTICFVFYLPPDSYILNFPGLFCLYFHCNQYSVVYFVQKSQWSALRRCPLKQSNRQVLKYIISTHWWNLWSMQKSNEVDKTTLSPKTSSKKQSGPYPYWGIGGVLISLSLAVEPIGG